MENVIKTLKTFKICRKIETMDEGKDFLYLRLHTYNEGKYESVTYYVLKNDCFVLDSVEFKDGKEIWDVGADRREELTRLYRDLQFLGKVELRSIKKRQIENKLTSIQLSVLNLAKDLGYYEWPRRISVTKLAKYFGLSKSTFVEHLRKAEAKTILNS